MTEGTPWKHIVRFAMPVLAGSLLQQLYNTVDAIVVGKFAGEAALSAVGTTGSFAFLFLALALGFSAGNGVVVAQQFGAGNEKEVRVNASTGILFLMMLGAAAAVIGIVLARPAYTLLVNVPESFLDLTLQYFRIYAVGLIFQYGYNIFSSILRAVGDSAATLYFLLISSVLNIVLDLAFVAGFHWGVAGAAAATDIAQAASFAAAYLYMTRKYPIFRFGLREYTWSGRCVRQTVRVGFPIALQLIIVSMGLTLIQRVVNGFGQQMTASFTVGQRIEMYLNLPCNAFQTTLATYTGQNYGAKQIDRCKRVVRNSMIIGPVTVLIVSSIFILFANQLASFFTSDPEVIRLAVIRSQIVLAIYSIHSFNEIMSGILRSLGYAIIPAWINIIFICGVRLIWLFFVFPMKPEMGFLMYCYPISWIVNVAILMPIFFVLVHRSIWKARTLEKC